MIHEQVDTDIAGYRAGRVLRVLGRPLRATEPCVGLGGLRRLCELSGSQYVSTQSFDTETSLLAYYENLQRFCGTRGVEGLRLGTAGDRGNNGWPPVPAMGRKRTAAWHS